MLQVGSLVDNKYKILSEVGRGGMSVVYLAINERANKTWAVKEVRKDGVVDFEAVKQGLVVETDMLKRLKHDHLPSIIDVIDTDESFLIVMDYIEGKSLQSVLNAGGAQPKDLVIEWGIQLCDVLGYLHSREPAIIYRDMKPSNVMLKPNGDVTLIDFGTAREFKNRAMVEDTTCLGTRGYAAPEQFGGRGQTDGRTDIYCLGATLYHLLTGYSPAEPPYEIKPLSYWDPSYAGSGLEYIIAKCTQQDPDQRYQTCAELMYDLEHIEDMDVGTIRARKKKWNRFVASAAMFVIGAVGMLVSALGGQAATGQTYDSMLEEAKRYSATSDFTQFSEQILETIAIDPGRYEAYDTLLDRIEDDGKLDMQTEWSVLLKSLDDSADGRTANKDALLGENSEQYADIQFRVGQLLFLMSDGDDASLQRSAPYFEYALSKGELTNEKQKQLAEALLTIGQNVEALKEKNNLYDSNNEYDYSRLWEDLNGLIHNNTINVMDTRSYGITLYNRVAVLINRNYDNFLANDISVAELNTLLNEIESALENTQATLTDQEKKRGFEDLIASGLTTIQSTEKAIDSKTDTGGVG